VRSETRSAVSNTRCGQRSQSRDGSVRCARRSGRSLHHWLRQLIDAHTILPTTDRATSRFYRAVVDGPRREPGIESAAARRLCSPMRLDPLAALDASHRYHRVRAIIGSNTIMPRGSGGRERSQSQRSSFSSQSSASPTTTDPPVRFACEEDL